MRKWLFRPAYWAILYTITCSIFVVEALFVEKMDYTFDFVGLGGTFRHHDLTIWGLPAYWFLMLVGFLVALWLCIKQREDYHFGRLAAVLVPVGFFITSYVGAKLLFLLEQKTVYAGNPTFTADGLSLFGAIFLVPAVAAVVGCFKPFSRPQLLDMCALLGITMLVFVRTGCFVSGCCGSPMVTCNHRPFHLPVQLIEVVLDLLLMEVCLHIRKKTGQGGWMYPAFAIGYGGYRFMLEFFRNTPKSFGAFTHSQLWAALCVTMGIVWMLWMRRRAKKNA